MTSHTTHKWVIVGFKAIRDGWLTCTGLRSVKAFKQPHSFSTKEQVEKWHCEMHDDLNNYAAGRLETKCSAVQITIEYVYSAGDVVDAQTENH